MADREGAGAIPHFEVEDDRGVSWKALEEIARFPERFVATTVQLVVDLRRQPGMRSTIQLAAKRLKATEAQVAARREDGPRLCLALYLTLPRA